VPLGDLPTLPAWVTVAASPPPPVPSTSPPPTIGTERASRIAAGALRSAVQRVVAAREGTRNTTLNTEAYALARFASAGDLAVTDLFNELVDAAASAGLTEGEAARTITAALRARSVTT